MTPEQQVRKAVAKLPKVRFEKGWNDPKIAGRGTWSPRFVMLHHTAGTKSLGPLLRTAWPPVRGAHFLIDRDGTVRVLSSSKAYHAGKGGPRFGVAAGMMNGYAWGIEIEDLGRGQTMTPAQIDAAAALTAGLLDAMGADLDAVIQHKEWNPGGKVDTRYSTSFWRDKVEAALAPPKVTQSSTFPVGHTELVSRKAADGNAITVTAGDWATITTIDIPAPGHYLNTMQLRLPGGTWAEVRMVRIGWGSDPDGRDETGLKIVHPRPDGRDTSDSYTHPIKGGGPLAFRIKLHGADGKVEIPTAICKSFRDY